MPMIELTTETFGKTLAETDTLVVDFWAEWCGPCKAFGRILDELVKEYPKVTFGKLNVDQCPDIARDFSIRSIPFVIIVRRGVIVFSQAGVLPMEEMRRLIQEALAIDLETLRKAVESQTQTGSAE